MEQKKTEKKPQQLRMMRAPMKSINFIGQSVFFVSPSTSLTHTHTHTHTHTKSLVLEKTCRNKLGQFISRDPKENSEKQSQELNN